MPTIESHSTSASTAQVAFGEYEYDTSPQTRGIHIMQWRGRNPGEKFDYTNWLSYFLLTTTTCWREMPVSDENILTETFGSKYQNASYMIELELIARNRRRASLLDKRIQNTLSEEESAELEQLQSIEDSRLAAELQPAIEHLRSLLNQNEQ